MVKSGDIGMKIGIFGGSFDPVHTEHIRVAQAAIKSLGLDKLLIMPAHTPPHKAGKSLSPDHERLELCRLAFENTAGAEVSDYEMRQGGTSFTYLTCEHFRNAYPNAELFWLVGTDMLRDFPTWKYPERILQSVTLAVCARNEADGWIEKERADFLRRFGKDLAVVAYNGAAVSSTKIRVLAGAGMRLTPFVPETVEAYIQEKHMYEIVGAKESLALQKPSRAEHSLRVALVAATRAGSVGVAEKKAIAAALLHDCAKNLRLDDPLLRGFEIKDEWGEVPESVLHQFTGAFVAQTALGVDDEEILDAIRFHTSGKENMTALGKLIFLADMVEEERKYDCVDILRELFWQNDDTLPPENRLDACLERALKETLLYLKKNGTIVYTLTEKAYAFYAKGDCYGKKRNQQ